MRRYDRIMQEATHKWRAGDLGGALKMLGRIVSGLNARIGREPYPAGCLEVDVLLQAIGEARAAQVAPQAGLQGTWILATILLEIGGHTALVGDILRAVDDVRGLMVTLSGQSANLLTRAAIERSGVSRCVVLDAENVEDKIAQAIAAWGTTPPSRIILLHHPADGLAVILAAMARAWGAKTVLMHHVDSRIAFGLYVRDCRIVDLTPRASAFTRFILGLESDYLPLTCEDRGTPPKRAFREGGTLVSATTGRMDKFPPDALPTLEDAITPLLAAGGRHVHIGELDVTRTNAIRALLKERGMSGEQFRILRVVKDFQAALVDERIDLLLNSWPQGGARAVVEAMAAGVPVVWHSPHPLLTRLRCQLAYPGATIWHDLSELTTIASAATPEWLAEQSRLARQCFENRHHPRNWSAYFETGRGLDLPDGFNEREMRLADARLNLTGHPALVEVRMSAAKFGIGKTAARPGQIEREARETRVSWFWRKVRRLLPGPQ